MTKGRKKRELIVLENGLKEKNIVQRSRPLFSLWKSELTLSEFKILDTYLSRIDSHNPEKRVVVIEKGQLEELLGVKKINKEDLEVRLVHLQKTIVNIGDEEKIDRITLFERSQAEKDEFGVWKVTLTCTSSAMKYIFNIDRMGYIRYQIRCITKIRSLYSYLLFTYLEYNRFQKSWEVDIENLKDILNCTSASYKGYKEFNDKILKKAKKEITEKTECNFTYEPVRKGRTVTGIRFTVETLKDLVEENAKEETLPGQMTIEDIETSSNSTSINVFEFLSSAMDNEFDEDELKVIFDIIVHKELPEHQYGLEFARFHYLKEKYDYMNLSEKRNNKKINDRFSYFKKMLENDVS